MPTHKPVDYSSVIPAGDDHPSIRKQRPPHCALDIVGVAALVLECLD